MNGGIFLELNRTEKFMMNNPVRSLLQRNFEARIFEDLGGKTPQLDVLEIGCGRGIGTEILFERFEAKSVVAIDIDSDMIKKADKRLRNFGNRVHLKVASATRLPLEDNSIDAVFDFGIIHHISDWENAISEIHRVLKPNGRFFFEEVSKKALDTWPYRTFLKHPKQNRFSLDGFLSKLESSGFEFVSTPVEVFFGHFFFGVARKI